jgi:hypothetical protein
LRASIHNGVNPFQLDFKYFLEFKTLWGRRIAVDGFQPIPSGTGIASPT